MSLLRKIFPERFSPTDRHGVIASAIFAIAAFVALAYVKPPSHSKVKKAIAKIESISNDVRYKESDSVSFFGIAKNEKLQNKDQIFTGENSSAVVRFLNSKTVLKIPSSSLIQIEDGENGDSIEIKEGLVDITIEKNHVLSVKINDVEHQITPGPKATSIKAYYDAGELRLLTKDSGVKIKNNKREYKLQTNKETSFKGDEVKVNPAFVLLSPSAEDRIDIVGGMHISTNQKSKYNITLSKNIDFNPPFFTTKFEGTDFKWTTLPTEGEYFLKIEDKKSNKVIPITLINKYKINGYIPGDGETLSLNPGEGTVLHWDPLPVNSYKVTIKDNEKEKVYIAYKNGLQLDNLKGHEFEWMVVPEIAKEKYSSVTKINKVGLKFNGKIKFTTERTQYRANEEKFNLAWESQKGEQFLVKAWDMKENRELFTKQTKEAGLIIPLKANGPYKAEVASLDYPRIEKSEFNYQVNVPVLIWDPTLKKEIKSTEDNEEITLRYNANLSSKRNVVLRTKYTPLKGHALDKKSKFTDRVKLEGFGQYCFKAQLISPLEYYNDSDDYCLSLIQQPVFPSPPVSKDTILEFAEHDGVESYKFEVPKIEKAVKYYLEIYTDRAGKKLIFSSDYSTPHFSWTTKRSGVYFYKYKVYDVKDRASEFSLISKLICPISPLSDW